jgi:hypothetical protein
MKLKQHGQCTNRRWRLPYQYVVDAESMLLLLVLWIDLWQARLAAFSLLFFMLTSAAATENR